MTNQKKYKREYTTEEKVAYYIDKIQWMCDRLEKLQIELIKQNNAREKASGVKSKRHTR